jgi:hypothetical protein
MEMKIKGLIMLFIVLNLISSACSATKPPADANGRPLIVKTGTIDCDLVKRHRLCFIIL